MFKAESSETKDRSETRTKILEWKAGLRPT